MHEQMQLPLFPAPDFNTLLAQKGIKNFTVTINARLKQSWRTRFNRYSGRIELFVPACCENAPQPIKEALITWALVVCNGKTKKGRSKFRQTKCALEEIISAHIKGSGVISRFNKFDTRSAERKTSGCKYDLAHLLAALNSAYFNNEIKTYIRWGSPRSRTSYQSIRRDSEGNRINLITIAGVYNHPNVPLFAIEGVIFHEMSHIKAVPYKRNGRNIIHHNEFKTLERSYPQYSEWRHWERATLPYLSFKKPSKPRKRFLLL